MTGWFGGFIDRAKKFLGGILHPRGKSKTFFIPEKPPVNSRVHGTTHNHNQKTSKIHRKMAAESRRINRQGKIKGKRN